MGCENELDQEAHAASSASVVVSSSVSRQAQERVKQIAARAASLIDRTGDAAILKARQGVAIAPAARGVAGDVAESAVVLYAVEQMGHALLGQNTSKGAVGIDVTTYDPKTGELFVWEVKSSAQDRAVDRVPQMKQTADGPQMSSQWLNNQRLERVGLDQARDTDVNAMVVKVDLKTGMARLWRIDPVTGVRAAEGGAVDLNDLLDLQA